jgi:hypothetical protein
MVQTPVLITFAIFLYIIFTISEAGPYGVAVAQKTQNRIWNEQHEGQVMKCIGDKMPIVSHMYILFLSVNP